MLRTVGLALAVFACSSGSTRGIGLADGGASGEGGAEAGNGGRFGLQRRRLAPLLATVEDRDHRRRDLHVVAREERRVSSTWALRSCVVVARFVGPRARASGRFSWERPSRSRMAMVTVGSVMLAMRRSRPWHVVSPA